CMRIVSYLFSFKLRGPPGSALFPYTTLFRSLAGVGFLAGIDQAADRWGAYGQGVQGYAKRYGATYADVFGATFLGGAVLPSLLRSEEHTSELQSRGHLVCRLLLEKKKNKLLM